MTSEPEPIEPAWSASRLETFSDSVLAIAVTLLVLNLQLPSDSKPTRLAHELRELWPSYLAYAVSFLVIGVVWANHHAIFRLIGRADTGLLLLNLLVLASAAALPFPASVLADNLGDPVAERPALVLYGGTLTAVSVWFLVLWIYVVRRGLLRDEAAPVAPTITRRLVVTTVGYLLALGVALVDARPGLLVWSALAVTSLAVMPTPALPTSRRRRG